MFHVVHCIYFPAPPATHSSIGICLCSRGPLCFALPCWLFIHSECSGSDTFGTDICTCRPYLVYALLGAVQCAQRGGVGIIIYFRKEGRSLGEVTKFRVYNARKRQPGGDTAENYFKQTVRSPCVLHDAFCFLLSLQENSRYPFSCMLCCVV
jgi:hypothetical protein